jgi:CBS domain-containing protein
MLMSVGKICQREVDFADPGEPVRAAAERMRARGVGCLVVLDPERRPNGILTDRDLVLRVIAEGRDPEATRVLDVMTQPVRVAAEESPIDDCLRLMRSGGFRRVPVVDRAGRLAGLVTLDDVLGLLAEEFEQVGALLSRESPRRAAAGGA